MSHPATRTLALTLLASLAVASTACGPDGSTDPTDPMVRALGPSAAVAPGIVIQTLHDQDVTVGGVVLTKNVCCAGSGPYKVYDDFTVPAAQTWVISQVRLAGNRTQALPVNVFPMELSFASSNPAPNDQLPGSMIQSFTLNPVSSTPDPVLANVEHFRFDLPLPVRLTGGLKWFEFTPIDLRWGWTTLGTVGRAAWVFHLGSWGTAGGFGAGGDPAFTLYGYVETPSTAIAELRATLASYGLDQVTARSLDQKLVAARDALARGDSRSACTALQNFISQVSALSTKQLSATRKATLIGEATRIRGMIRC